MEWTQTGRGREWGTGGLNQCLTATLRYALDINILSLSNNPPNNVGVEVVKRRDEQGRVGDGKGH